MPLPVNVPFRSLQCRAQVRRTGDAFHAYRLRDALNPCLRLFRTLGLLGLLLNSMQINEVRQRSRQCALARSMLQKAVERINATGKERRGFSRAFANIRFRGRATDLNALERRIPCVEDIPDAR